MENPVQKEMADRAVSALLKWRDNNSQSTKPQLLEDVEMLYLILTLNMIPTTIQTKPVKVPVPHPLYHPSDGTEVCLIYDDRPKSTLTKEYVKKKIEDEEIPISKVLKLSKLKSDYRAFEAKRKLCGSYDIFLADKRVIPLLPKMLGKQFFKGRKIPIAVNLEHQNWKEQVESSCSSALLFLRTGNCCVVKVGKISMGGDHLVENVIAAINYAYERVPVLCGNIRALHLKLSESLALPIFQKLPDMKCSMESVKEPDSCPTKERKRRRE